MRFVLSRGHQLVRAGLSGRPALLLTLALLAPITAIAAGQLSGLAEQPAIAYSASTPTDPVAALARRIDAGEVTLAFDAAHGYLPALLRALKIPASSQGLVFSKTSLQLDRIAPWTPRAIYFNDDVYIGSVQGSPFLEIASADPKLGAVFYTLAQRESPRPAFERQNHTCLVCHNSAVTTDGVPGFIMRSVYTDRYGYAIPLAPEGVTTDQTPIEQRWGGWYVTGTHGAQEHLGNLIGPVPAHEIVNVADYVKRIDRSSGANVTDLSSRFNTKPYLTAHSDIVALLVLAHQTHVHNLMTVAGYEARTGSSEQRIAAAAERLVRAMLLTKEAPFASPIKGTSGFAEAFAAEGPRDHLGRSLRDLDLDRRLFRYPLSYLIYSESFDALPPAVKDHVYRRLHDVLGASGTSDDFPELSAADRKAILGILVDTKPDFAASDRGTS